MSYRYSALVLQAEKTKALDAVKDYISRKGGGVLKAEKDEAYGSDDPNYFSLGEKNGWTFMVFSDSGLIPGMVIGISEMLQARVLGLDKNETVGYEHYSETESGKVKIAYTNFDGVRDEIGVDWEAIKKSVDEKIKGAEQHDYEYGAFDYLQSQFSDLGIEEESLDSYENSNEWFQVVDVDLDDERMGSEPENFWTDLASGEKKSD